ncbi:nuclear transport factor 2 family protein [Sphingobium sp.]|uniref:nuclear transport factor 2 family protein n=1 Tax=Sphingobium sp. TaxID=1912891 RepID=UPI0028BDB3B4|nr:nuclear transport factor 2 family protein [Sphingobium sp.]
MDNMKAEELLSGALHALTQKDVQPWIDMFAEDGVMEFPFALPGYPGRVDGKQAIADYLADYPDHLSLSAIHGPKFHHSGEVMIAEFSVEGTAVATGRPYNQRYISVITFQGDNIAMYRDYWNPVVAIEALGGVEKLLEFGKEG